MKKTALTFSTAILLLLVLTSCGQLITEIEALKKNEQGLTELNAGQLDKAVESFKEAIKSPKLSTGTKAQIYRNISQTFSEMDEPDSSIHYSTLAANCYDKNSYDYLVNIADVEILTGQTADALEKLQRAVKMEPDELAVNNTLGLIYLGIYGFEFSDPEKALTFNKKAYKINKDRITEDVLGRNYFEIGDYRNAEKHFERLSKEHPDIWLYKLHLGMTKFKQDKHTEADVIFDQLVKIDSSIIYTINAFKDENK